MFINTLMECHLRRKGLWNSSLFQVPEFGYNVEEAGLIRISYDRAQSLYFQFNDSRQPTLITTNSSHFSPGQKYTGLVKRET